MCGMLPRNCNWFCIAFEMRAGLLQQQSVRPQNLSANSALSSCSSSNSTDAHDGELAEVFSMSVGSTKYPQQFQLLSCPPCVHPRSSPADEGWEVPNVAAAQHSSVSSMSCHHVCAHDSNACNCDMGELQPDACDAWRPVWHPCLCMFMHVLHLMMLWPKGSARCFVRPSMGCSRVTSACTAKPTNATCRKHTFDIT